MLPPFVLCIHSDTCTEYTATVESQFFEYLIIRNSRFFEPKVVSPGFASVKHCNCTPDFSNILDFSKLLIFRTNSFFLSKIYIRFLEL